MDDENVATIISSATKKLAAGIITEEEFETITDSLSRLHEPEYQPRHESEQRHGPAATTATDTAPAAPAPAPAIAAPMAAVETVADWDQQREEVVEAVLLYEAADDSTPTSPWAGQEDGGRFVAAYPHDVVTRAGKDTVFSPQTLGTLSMLVFPRGTSQANFQQPRKRRHRRAGGGGGGGGGGSRCSSSSSSRYSSSSSSSSSSSRGSLLQL